MKRSVLYSSQPLQPLPDAARLRLSSTWARPGWTNSGAAVMPWNPSSTPVPHAGPAGPGTGAGAWGRAADRSLFDDARHRRTLAGRPPAASGSEAGQGAPGSWGGRAGLRGAPGSSCAGRTALPPWAGCDLLPRLQSRIPLAGCGDQGPLRKRSSMNASGVTLSRWRKSASSALSALGRVNSRTAPRPDRTAGRGNQQAGRAAALPRAPATGRDRRLGERLSRQAVRRGRRSRYTPSATPQASRRRCAGRPHKAAAAPSAARHRPPLRDKVVEDEDQGILIRRQPEQVRAAQRSCGQVKGQARGRGQVPGRFLCGSTSVESTRTSSGQPAAG